MKKPIIGISGSMMVDTTGDIFVGYQRSYTNDDYVQSVTRAGGIPIMLPIIDAPEQIEQQVELLDGLIMMGGHDVDPVYWGEEPTAQLGFIYPRRDRFDMALIKAAVARNIPILGICRGHQIINVTFGGSLYQDLSEIEGAHLAHVQKTSCFEPIHDINVKSGSQLASWIGDKLRVNSFHHLAVKDLAPGFEVVATSNDNVIEAIEYKSADQFILGVQFHPEMMSATDAQAANIFNGFITTVNKVKEVHNNGK